METNAVGRGERARERASSRPDTPTAGLDQTVLALLPTDMDEDNHGKRGWVFVVVFFSSSKLVRWDGWAAWMDGWMHGGGGGLID